MVGIFQCTGQVCSATSRLLVHESLEKELLERLLSAMKSIKVGDPLQKGTLMGPVVSEVDSRLHRRGVFVGADAESDRDDQAGEL